MTDTLRTGLAATFSLRTFSRAAFGCLLGAALLVPGTPARAGDNDDGVPIDTKIIRGILEGIGLRRDGSESISYGERAPLVLPPTHTLPPPEKSDAALTNNPAWPKDPDVSRRKLEAEQERNRNISEEREREQNPLRSDQLTPGGNPRTAARRSQGDSYTATPGDRLSAKEMNQKTSIWSSMFGSKDDEVAKFTREPPRAALTEPPPGYQTPSPEQPYGVGKEKPKTKTSADYLLEHAAGEQR
jgi:hypothetical protein